MSLPTQNLLAWEISVTFFHLLGIGATFLRLGHRWRTKRMWWDDYSAFVVLLVDVLFIIFMWLRFRYGVAGIISGRPEGFLYSAWLAVAMGWTVIWGSRISLTLSIARIFPENHLCRRFSFGLSTLFSLSYLAILLISTLLCKPSEGAWYNLLFSRKSCLKARGSQVLAFLVVDFAADILLVVTPLVMLWEVKLPINVRRLILALFSSSLISLLSSITFAVAWFILVDSGVDSIILSAMFAALQAGINLLICNLLLITMLVYRILNRKKQDNVSSTGPSSAPVTGDRATSDNLAIQSDDSNSSTGNWTSNDDALATSILFTTGVYDTLSGLSSAPPPSSKNSGPTSRTYFTREEE